MNREIVHHVEERFLKVRQRDCQFAGVIRLVVRAIVEVGVERRAAKHVVGQRLKIVEVMQHRREAEAVSRPGECCTGLTELSVVVHHVNHLDVVVVAHGSSGRSHVGADLQNPRCPNRPHARVENAADGGRREPRQSENVRPRWHHSYLTTATQPRRAGHHAVPTSRTRRWP